MKNQSISLGTKIARYTIYNIYLTVLLLFLMLMLPFSANASEPVVILSTDGGATTAVSLNDQEVTLDWEIQNAGSCEILFNGIDVVYVLTDDDYPNGSVTITPPADSESSYVLSCVGISSTVSVGLEPTVSVSLSPQQLVYNAFSGFLDNFTTFSWTSENADFCHNFSIRRLSDGRVETFSDSPGVSQSSGSVTLFQLQYEQEATGQDWWFVNWNNRNNSSVIPLTNDFLELSDYEVSATCRNQTSGVDVTVTDILEVIIPDDLPDIEMWFLMQPEHFTYGIGSMKRELSASHCQPWQICQCNEDVCHFEYEETPGADFVLLTGPITQARNATSCTWLEGPLPQILTEPTTITNTRECTQVVNGVTRTHSQGITITWSPERDVSDNDALISDFPPTAFIQTLNQSNNPIESIVMSPSADPNIIGQATITVFHTSENVDRCESRVEIRPDGTEVRYGEGIYTGWSFERYDTRTLTQAGTYTYYVDCFREMVSLAEGGSTTGRLYAERAITTIEVIPPPEAPDPIALLDAPVRTTEDDAPVSLFSISWSSENASQCEFSAVNVDTGNDVVLSNLQPGLVNAIQGTRNQGFPSNGQRIAITLTCTGGGGRTASDTQEIAVPSIVEDSTEAQGVTAVTQITTGQCVLNGVTINLQNNVGLGYYREDSSEILPCLRFVPNVIVFNIDLPDLTQPITNQTPWEFDVDEEVFNDVDINFTLLNNDDSAFVFGIDGEVTYQLLICHNEIEDDCTEDLADHVINGSIQPDAVPDGEVPPPLFAPNQPRTVTERVSGIPLGEHRVVVRVDRMRQVAGEDMEWHERADVLSTALPSPDLEITLNRAIGRPGEEITAMASVRTVYPVSCTVRGPGLRSDGVFPNFIVSLDGAAQITEYSEEFSFTAISSGDIILTCSDQLLLIGQEHSSSVRFEMLPVTIER